MSRTNDIVVQVPNEENPLTANDNLIGNNGNTNRKLDKIKYSIKLLDQFR